MTINLNKFYLTEKFKTADTADKLRSVTTEQILAAFGDEVITTVHAENIQKQLLKMAARKEVNEFYQRFLTSIEKAVKAEFPDAVIESKLVKSYPCILVWPKGKWQEGDDE